MRVIINGIYGKMGKCLKDACEAQGLRVVAGVDKYAGEPMPFPVYANINEYTEGADAIIDFSRPDALKEITDYGIAHNIPVVIATTGFSNEEIAFIRQSSAKIPVFFTANMSLGVNLQLELARIAAKFLGESFDIEIIEKHHNMKVDSPSGTALLLANGINDVLPHKKEYEYNRHAKVAKREPKELGIHSIRGGTIVGEHQVLFIGDNEVIEITHKAESRTVFANGAVKAAKFVFEKPPGLYSMADVVKEM